MATLVGITTPPGLNPALVIDFDLYDDPRFVSAGGVFEAMGELSAQAPDVFWSPLLGGYWVIQGYDAIVEAAKRGDLFTSSRMGIPPAPEDSPQRRRLAPLNFDPPDHAALRSPLNPIFTPAAMNRWSGQIRKLAVELVENVRPRGKADFFDEVTEQLPVLIFIDLMGLKRSDYRFYRALAKAAVATRDRDTRYEAMLQAYELLKGEIAERRARPREDLISQLLALEVSGEPISDELALAYLELLFFAGLDTVANAMTFAVRYLAKDQALQQRLRDDPAKIPHAMEELLRRHAVAPVMRMVTHDFTWRGFNFRAGDPVLLNYPAANLDERMFANGTKVDIDRERINHVAFGAGHHRCLGRNLARIEIVIFFEELLSRLPTFRLAPGEEVPMMGGSVMSITRLPIVWQAG
ncbi:MAG: cytochrome P450 [Alphaproteobacteria bacterium]|nr:cytochrome P450 [Alphaproteobacteria bacterium]